MTDSHDQLSTRDARDALYRVRAALDRVDAAVSEVRAAVAELRGELMPDEGPRHA